MNFKEFLLIETTIPDWIKTLSDEDLNSYEKDHPDLHKETKILINHERLNRKIEIKQLKIYSDLNNLRKTGNIDNMIKYIYRGGGHIRNVILGKNLGSTAKQFKLTDEELNAYNNFVNKQNKNLKDEKLKFKKEQEIRSENKKINKEKWMKYLEKHNLENNEYGKILANVLEDPDKADIKWFHLAIDSLKSNKDSGGKIWKQYEEDGTLSFKDIKTAIGAYIRHNFTNYDKLLKYGIDRDDARDMIKYE